MVADVHIIVRDKVSLIYTSVNSTLNCSCGKTYQGNVYDTCL